MAKINYKYAEEVDDRVLLPDEAGLSAANKDSRPERLESAIELALDRIGNISQIDAGMASKDSRPQEYADEMAKKIFESGGIFDQATKTQISLSNRNSSDGNLEALILANSSKNVSDRVYKTSASAKTSVLACELLEKTLLESREKISTELQAEREKLSEILEQKRNFTGALDSKWTRRFLGAAALGGAAATGIAGFWPGVIPLLSAGIGTGTAAAGFAGSKVIQKMNGKSTSAAKKTEQKLAQFDAAFEQKLQQLESELAKTKKEALHRRTEMQTRIQRKIENAKPLSEKSKLIDQIKLAAQHSGDDLTFPVPTFIGADEKNVFLEAIAETDWLSGAIAAAGKSKVNSQRQNDLLEVAKKQQNFLSDDTNYSFEALLQEPKFQTLPKMSGNETINLSDLVREMERAASASGQNMSTIYPKELQYENILDDGIRLIRLIQSFGTPANLASKLPFQTAQKLKTWLVQQDENTRPENLESVELMTAGVEHFENLQKDGGIFDQMNKAIKSTQTLMNSKKATDAAAWQRSKILPNWYRLAIPARQDFNADKALLPADAAAKLEELWNAVNQAENNLKKFHQQKIKDFAKITVFPSSFVETVAQFESFKSQDFLEKPNPARVYSLPELNIRMRHQFLNRFADEVEQKFLSEMEKNDNFESVGNSPVGTKVQVKIQSCSGSREIHFPSDFRGGMGKNFIIKTKTDSGILLESSTDSQMIFLHQKCVGDPESGEQKELIANAVMMQKTSASYGFDSPELHGKKQVAIAYDLKVL